MTVPDLMDALRAHGATLTLQGDSLKLTAPAPLPDALMDAVRAHKADVLAALRTDSAEPRGSLPPVHDADDPRVKPTKPCTVCGEVRWRVWCHDERKVWQWLCNRCRPLVVVHKDGRRWRA